MEISQSTDSLGCEEEGTQKIINKEFKNSWEINYIRNFPFKTKGFQNLFDDVALKYWIYQGNTSYCLAGLTPQGCLETMTPPFLPISSLLSQMELISESVFAKKYNDNDTLYLPNLKKAVEDVEVFLVTKEIEGTKHIVHNLFKNGEENTQTIPNSQKLGEGVGFDALGMYINETGSIYLWVDKIFGFCYNQLLFQSVLLHELIHLLFDVMRKSLELKNSTEIHEETIDNCLLLYCYDQAVSQHEDGARNAYLQIRSFVNSQRGVYAAAGPMFDKANGWSDLRSKLITFFQNK